MFGTKRFLEFLRIWKKGENISILLTDYRPLLIIFWHPICNTNCKCCCKNNLNLLQNFCVSVTVHLRLDTITPLPFLLLRKSSSMLTGTTLGTSLLQWGQSFPSYHNIPKFNPSSQKDVKELLLWKPLTEHSLHYIFTNYTFKPLAELPKNYKGYSVLAHHGQAGKSMQKQKSGSIPITQSVLAVKITGRFLCPRTLDSDTDRVCLPALPAPFAQIFWKLFTGTEEHEKHSSSDTTQELTDWQTK